jgi:hypothetical protein
MVVWWPQIDERRALDLKTQFLLVMVMWRGSEPAGWPDDVPGWPNAMNGMNE